MKNRRLTLAGKVVYHETWDIEGSLARRRGMIVITPGTPIGGVAPGPGVITIIPRRQRA